MPAKLSGEQKLVRQIKVYGLETPVNVTLTAEGITFKAPGAKTGVSATWARIVSVCRAPESAPSYLVENPLLFLERSASKLIQTKLKKETAKEAIQ